MVHTRRLPFALTDDPLEFSLQAFVLRPFKPRSFPKDESAFW